MLVNRDKMNPRVNSSLGKMIDEIFSSAVSHTKGIDKWRHRGEISGRNSQSVHFPKHRVIGLTNLLPAFNKFLDPLNLRDAYAGKDVCEVIAKTGADHIIFP